MATAATPGKAASPSRSEAFVQEQLRRAQQRIRLLDLATVGLGFLAGTFAFAVLMAVADRHWQFSGPIRQLALLLYLCGAASYLGLTVVRPLLRKINPYYAARQLEQTLPQAKNSVINWLDLNGQKLPAAVRGAIGSRAAKDLAKTDLEKAISGQRTLVAGLLAGVLGAVFLFLFLLFGPSQFVSLVRRAFAPFDLRTTVSTRTQLSVLRPEGGTARIPAGLAVTIAVQVDGRVPDPGKPDAVKLHWRHDASQPYQVTPLAPQESIREWATVLSVADVREGFFYKITGGDAETEEYRVTIVTAPMPTEVIATYRYRPYLGKPDEVRRDRRIEALRGTEVTLLVRTNRIIKAGQLLLETRAGKQTITGDRAGDDPHAFQVRFVVTDTGLYRLRFESTEDETYTDSLFYPITALPDRPPEVEITSPARDTQEPANGLLKVEGMARDDIGVKSVTLRIHALGGPPLRGKEYRAEKGLKLPGGGYPLTVDYKDVLELSGVQTADGKPYPMQPGMELEYWLEAADCCDFPKANVAQSKKYKVQIVAPDKDPQKQQQARDQARKEQKEHEAREEQKRKQEEQARADQKRKEEQARKDQEAAQEKPQDGMGENKPEQGMGNQGEPKPEQGMGNQQNPEQKHDDETRKQAEEIQRALDEQNKGQQGNQNQGQDKGQSKGENPGAGSNKEGGKGNEGQQGNKQEPGENKQGGQPGQEKQAGQQKEGGQPGQQGNQGAAAGKDGQQGGKEGQGENKQGGQPGAEKQASEGKDQGKEQGKQGQDGPQQAGKAGDGKGDDKGSAGKQAGQDKSGGPQAGQQAAAQGKEGGKDSGQGQQQARADSKAPSANQAGGTGKDAGKDGPKGADGSGMAKSGDKKADGDRSQGASKSGGEKTGEPQLARGQGKGDPERHSPNEANLNDLKRQWDNLQSNNPRQREQAAQELDRIKEQAKDPQVRDLARRLADELNKLDNQTAEAKPASQGAGNKPPPGDERPGQGKEASEPSQEPAQGKGAAQPGGSNPPGSAKDGGKDEKKGGDPPRGNPQEGNSQGSEGQGETREGRATVKNPGAPPKPGAPPPEVGEKIAAGQRGNDEQPRTPETQSPRKPETPVSQRATDTQLEDFKKKLDKKLLERLKMTEEAREQFLKNYAELVKREKAAPAKPETPPTQQGGTISSAAGRPAATTNPAPAADTTGSNRGQPPPGYRDDYAEFTKMLAKPPKK